MNLVFQVTGRDLRLFVQACWCEYVSVSDLIVAVFEVTRLDPAPFNQALDAVVGFAQADAHFLGQLALAQVGMAL